jgi:peptidoglycan/LPS O-acetylase OafA/YrhL
MRIEQLTFTRFLAAISIIIYHFGMDLFPFRTEAISFLFKQANLGVSYFFILSGFVMIIAYGGKGRIDPKKYYVTRLARIYPIYFISLIMLVIYYIIRHKEIDPVAFGMNLFAIQSWFPSYALSLNTPSWSLVVEFFFYALFPFLFNRVYSKSRFIKLAISILLFWILSQVFFNLLLGSSFYHGFFSKSRYLLFYFPMMHLNEFLIGNLGGMIFLKTRKEYVRNYDKIIILLLVALVLLLRFPMSWSYHNGLMAIIFIPFILMLSLNNGYLSHLFNKKPMVFLGEISYGIYILQFPMYFWSQGFLKLVGIMNGYILFFVPFVILISVSAISYVYIEVPIRNWVKHKCTKRELVISSEVPITLEKMKEENKNIPNSYKPI